MPRMDENVIILESDDDDEALSGDKDDVVFVNMTPVGLQPVKIKSYLTPISIDSDDEDDDDDDIIFVSATAGKRRKLHVPLNPVDDAVSVLQLEQTLSSLEQTVNAASDALTVQAGVGDVLAQPEAETLILQPMTPKLPPAQPSFHDNTNVVDVTDSMVVEVLPPTSTPGAGDTTATLNAVNVSRLHSVDSGVGTLSAFLTGDLNQASDTCVSLSPAQTTLGSWDDTSSTQQGLLAWLRDLTLPSSMAAPSAGTIHVADARKADPSPTAGPALPTTSSVALTSFQTIENLLSPPQPSYSTAMTTAKPTSSYDVMTPSVSCSYMPSVVTSSSPFSSSGSLNKSLLSSRPFLNPAPNSCQNLGPDVGSLWAQLDQTVLPSIGSAGCASDSNNNSTISGTYASVLAIMSPSPAISTSPTSMIMTSTTSMSSTQPSGVLGLSQPSVARISPCPTTPPPKSPAISCSSSSASSSSLGVFTWHSSSTSSTFTSPSKASGGSIPSSSSVTQLQPVSVAELAPPFASTQTSPARVSQRGKASGSIGSVKLQSRKLAASKKSTAQATPQLKRSASYMQTHPYNIPLKKRCRHRHGHCDSVADSGGGGDADSSKCSWCKLMVPYSKLSHCMQGHPCCADCLQHRAKALLSKSKQGSLKCPYASCVSYFPMSQLQRTLPPMVVEILEEKLDQEYINYADDLLWHNIGEHEGVDGGVPGDEDVDDDDEDEDDEDDDDDVPLVGSEHAGIGAVSKQPALPLLPVFWKSMDDTSAAYKLVELSSENIEFTKISCLFNDTMHGQASILRIVRIQNPILWQFYNVKKLQLQESNGGVVLEKQLMHGTSNNVVDAICKTNFDWRLCGAHGTLYGQGTYFARDAAYSHVYTDNARHRSLQNPGQILAMLKTKKVPANLCLRRLAGSGRVGLGVVSSSATSTSYTQPLHSQPPPAHWKQGQQSVVLQPGRALAPAVGMAQAPPALAPPASAPPVNSMQSRMNVLGPLIGSTTTGNSGLNLSMRTSPLILALHRQAHHINGLQANLMSGVPPPLPPPPPPAHQRRYLMPGCSGGGGGGNGPSALHSVHVGPLSQSLRARWRTMLINDTSTASSNSSSMLSSSGSLSSSSVSSPTSTSSSSQGITASHQKRPVHSMFVAKVLVGRYTTGENHYRKPPPIDPMEPYGPAYDSCVDHVIDPKIYVVFDSAQCYPEYLIEYTSNNSSSYM